MSPQTAKAAAPAATAAQEPILLREDISSIAVLTLNRPQARNSLSEAMLRRLATRSRDRARATVRAVISPQTVRLSAPGMI